MKLFKISHSKILKLFLKNSPKVIVCEVLVVVCINLSYYIFFKVILHSILSINSIPKSRDFLSLFRVHISSLGDKGLNKVKL